MDEGIETCVSDEQPEKAYDPIELMDEGIEICVSDEQFMNDSGPICLILLLILMFLIIVLFLNLVSVISRSQIKIFICFLLC